MIQLNMTNKRAIALLSLIESLEWLNSRKLPEHVRHEAIAGLAASEDLKAIAQSLTVNLDQIKQEQESRVGIDNSFSVLRGDR